MEDQLSADFWRDPGVQLVNSGLQWLGARLGGILQIVGGSITFVFGTGIAFGGGVFTGGLSLIPGVALMGVGMDEILTGVYNVSNPNVQSMSVLGYGFYSGAQALGASDGTAQVMSALGPMALTLGLGAWGAMGKVVFYRGTTYFDALETVSNQAVNVNRLKAFQLGRNLDLGMGLYMSRSRATAVMYAEWLGGVGGGPGMVRIQLSRFRWLIMRWRYGALDNIPISDAPGLFQSFVPLGSLNFFNQYAQFFFVPLL